MNHHSDEHVAELAASIKEFGWTIPVLIDGDNVLVAGHGRVLAARKLGIDVVPCIRRDDWSETQIRAYRIADNRLPKNADVDSAMLTLELRDLQTLDFDLGLLGFADDELAAMFADTPPAADEPNVEPPKEWLLVITCGNENEQCRLFDQLTKDGIQCKIM